MWMLCVHDRPFCWTHKSSKVMGCSIDRPAGLHTLPSYCRVRSCFLHVCVSSPPPLQIHWKLCVFCLLCEAYLRWSLLHGSEQSSDPADIIRYTKEWEFYSMFGLASLGKTVTFVWKIENHPSLSDMSVCWFCRAVGVLRRCALLPLGGGGSPAEQTPGAQPAPQRAAAVLLWQSPPDPRCHLGARLLPALSGPPQTVCAHLKLPGYQR